MRDLDTTEQTVRLPRRCTTRAMIDQSPPVASGLAPAPMLPSDDGPAAFRRIVGAGSESPDGLIAPRLRPAGADAPEGIVVPVPVRVVVADDNVHFRAGIVRALGRSAGVEVLGEAADGSEALDLVRALRPDVAVVDARMPVLDGLGLARAVTDDPALRDVRVVLLSARHDAALTAEAHAAGALACLDKARTRREICTAVREIATGPALRR